MEDWENVLIILNLCLMFIYQDKDVLLMFELKDVFMFIMNEIRLDDIDSELEGCYFEQVDLSLLGLCVVIYWGIFKEVYDILIKMIVYIGWDQLFKIWSFVFVMEDEYCIEKQDSVMIFGLRCNLSIDGLCGIFDLVINGDDQFIVDEDVDNVGVEKYVDIFLFNGVEDVVEKLLNIIDF